MQKRIIKTWLFLASFGLLAALGLTVTSCGNDDPDPVAATADFTFTVTGASVAFTNTSINGQEYSWDFGDGSTASTEQSPTHVYTASGKYTVELKARGDVGTTVSVKTAEVDVQVPLGPNLLEGGNFEAADAAKWTIVGTGADMLPKVEFGSTANVPTGGSGGALKISNPDGFVSATAPAKGPKVEMVMYRSIALEAGKTYTISALINHGPLTATSVADGGPKEAFVSIEIANAAPSGTAGWEQSDKSGAKVLIHRYCVCWMGTTQVAVNGPWKNEYTTTWIDYIMKGRVAADVDFTKLDFSVVTSGTYYVGFKAGLGDAAGATFSQNGFVVDNVAIREKK